MISEVQLPFQRIFSRRGPGSVDLLVYSLCVYLNRLVSVTISILLLRALSVNRQLMRTIVTFPKLFSLVLVHQQVVGCVCSASTLPAHQVFTETDNWPAFTIRFIQVLGNDGKTVDLVLFSHVTQNGPTSTWQWNVCRWRKPSTAVGFLLILSALSSPTSQDANGSSDLTQ